MDMFTSFQNHENEDFELARVKLENYEFPMKLDISSELAGLFCSFGKIGGWGVLNQEIVSFRSCVRTRGLVA